MDWTWNSVFGGRLAGKAVGETSVPTSVGDWRRVEASSSQRPAPISLEGIESTQR